MIRSHKQTPDHLCGATHGRCSVPKSLGRHRDSKTVLELDGSVPVQHNSIIHAENRFCSVVRTK